MFFLEYLPGKVGGGKGDKLEHLGEEVAEENRRLQTHLEAKYLWRKYLHLETQIFMAKIFAFGNPNIYGKNISQ